MKIAVCFLAIISCAVAVPAEVPVDAWTIEEIDLTQIAPKTIDIFPAPEDNFETPDEIDLSKIVPNNIYLEPIHPVDESNIPQGRIIGGSEVARNSVPHQAVVMANGNSLCGGSLITTNRVLTAAHCTVGASFVNVRLGAHAFNTNEATQVRLTSTSIRNHANYNQGSFAANDVAIVHLPSSVSINNNIRTISIAASSTGSLEGSTAFLSGWGRTSDSSTAVAPNLRGINLNIISNAVCRNSFGNDIVTGSLCTSGAGTVGACSGDSGGPLTVNGVQVGVVSFGSSRCQAALPSVFARVSTFANWIVANV